eukprot:scaffold73583_cov62-Phaeocystis_antarctica.AAC.5
MSGLRGQSERRLTKLFRLRRCQVKSGGLVMTPTVLLCMWILPSRTSSTICSEASSMLQWSPAKPAREGDFFRNASSTAGSADTMFRLGSESEVIRSRRLLTESKLSRIQSAKATKQTLVPDASGADGCMYSTLWVKTCVLTVRPFSFMPSVEIAREEGKPAVRPAGLSARWPAASTLTVRVRDRITKSRLPRLHDPAHEGRDVLTHLLVTPVHRDCPRVLDGSRGRRWVRRIRTEEQATKDRPTSNTAKLHGAPDDSVPIGRRHVDRRAALGRGDVDKQEQPGCGHVDALEVVCCTPAHRGKGRHEEG